MQQDPIPLLPSAATEATMSAAAPPLSPMLEAVNVSCGYGSNAVLEAINLQVAPGEMVALLGRNGSGKSTLLRCLAGALQPLTGEIRLSGELLSLQGRRAVARLLAVVPQELHVPFTLHVRELVDLGRAPHARFLQPATSEDRAAVDRALAAADLIPLADRTYQQISGGEQQRTALAMALAQEPRILLLDEPTVHLDIAHQLVLLDSVRRLCAQQGLAVLAAIHDINLAALYFDRLLMLGNGRLLATGTAEEVLTTPLIERAFGIPVVVGSHPTLHVPQVSLLPR